MHQFYADSSVLDFNKLMVVKGKIMDRSTLTSVISKSNSHLA